jgi:hypothetical protein
MVVSRRSGKRPPRWAARLQARVGSGSASPPRFEPTVLASPRSLSQFGLARLVSAGRRARCCHAEGAPVGAIGPNFGGTLDRCRSVPGSATQAKPTGSGARTHGAFRQLPLRRCCTAASGGRLTEAQECEAAPRFMTKSQLTGPLPIEAYRLTRPLIANNVRAIKMGPNILNTRLNHLPEADR